MRTLFTLIKRQVVDDKAYLVGTLTVSAILLVILCCLGLIYPDLPIIHVFAFVLALPAFVSIGCFTFGVAQTCSQEMIGSYPFLSVLSVASRQILLSRVVSGTLVILAFIVTLAIAITGGVLSELISWPKLLFPGGLIDLLTSMFLVGLACYCLGLNIAQKASTLTSALSSLPLALILSLLIVIKGFGLPLISIAVFFIGASLVNLLKPSQRRQKTIVATGLQVMVLLGITIFWGRYSCEVALVANLPEGADSIRFRDTGLHLSKYEDANSIRFRDAGLYLSEYRKDPYGIHIIGASGYINSFKLPYYHIHYTFESLGIFEYLRSKKTGLRDFNLNHFDDNRGTYFDKTKGLVVHCSKKYKFFIGPKGISETPDGNLGRFSSPIIWFYSWPVLYIQQNNLFFAIDIEDRTFRKGPEIIDFTRRPIQINGPYNLPGECTVYISDSDTAYFPHGYSAVLDESGRIDLLDQKTLELVGPAGFLPRPRTLFGRGSEKPKDLLAYDVELLFENDQKDYVGMAVGSLSRQGTTMALSVFDKKGNQIKTAHTKAEFFKTPWGPALMVTKYIFESLHPPVLTLASFFTAYSFDARSSHRALFLMPNSFVAMARDYEGNIFYKFLLVLLLMLPRILFAALLGWLVARDAAIIGLSQNARRFWIAGTLVFGLPAYITYRLTRPKITLVTCANCGNLRRTDTSICHRCGSKWEVPELIPPTWRVLNGAE